MREAVFTPAEVTRWSTRASAWSTTSCATAQGHRLKAGSYVFDPDFDPRRDHQVGGRHRRRARRRAVRAPQPGPRPVGPRSPLPRADGRLRRLRRTDPVHREAQPQAARASAVSTRCTRTTRTGSASPRTRRGSPPRCCSSTTRRSTTPACASSRAATSPGCGRPDRRRRPFAATRSTAARTRTSSRSRSSCRPGRS